MGKYAMFKGLENASGMLGQVLQNVKTEKRYDELLKDQENKQKADYENKLTDTIITNAINLLNKGQADLYKKKLNTDNIIEGTTAPEGTIVAGRQVGKTGTPTVDLVQEDGIDYANVLKALRSGDAVIKPNMDVINKQNSLKNTAYKLKKFEAEQINEFYGTDYQEGDELPVSVVSNYLQGRKANKLFKDKIGSDITTKQTFQELRDMDKVLADPILSEEAKNNASFMKRYNYLNDLMDVKIDKKTKSPKINTKGNFVIKVDAEGNKAKVYDDGTFEEIE